MKQQTRRLRFRGCSCCITTPALPPPRRVLREASLRSAWSWRRTGGHFAGPGANAGGGASRGPLFAADAGAGPMPGAQSGSGTAAAAKPHRIDTHHHIAPPKFIDEMRALLQPPTLAWTIEKSRSEEHTSELQSLRHLVCRL